jgi:lactate dehydrogenase-like 2-hydroxyacid dehydrogenase
MRMNAERISVLLVGPKNPVLYDGLKKAFNLHVLEDAADKSTFLESCAEKIRAIAVSSTTSKVDAGLMQSLPALEIVSSFGVGYDHVDVKWAAQSGIMVTHTPEVLNAEVADTAVALLLDTVYGLPQAERHFRAGEGHGSRRMWGASTLRDRTIGMVGMGQIGKEIARRLEAFEVPIVYHARNQQLDVSYRYYPSLVDMARDVDTLLVMVPGGPATQNLINASVLEALGANGVLINMARGSVVDEQALIDALKKRQILSAGLDVFPHEPDVNPELIAMDHIVLLPHVGSASVPTRSAMDQLVVDNLLAWARGDAPLTPVPELRAA